MTRPVPIISVDSPLVDITMERLLRAAAVEQHGWALECGVARAWRFVLLESGLSLLTEDMAEMDLTALPFRDQTFSVTVIRRVMEAYAGEVATTMLRELARVTGGTLLVHSAVGIMKDHTSRTLMERDGTVSTQHPGVLFAEVLQSMGFATMTVHEYKMIPDVIIMAKRPEVPHVESGVRDL